MLVGQIRVCLNVHYRENLKVWIWKALEVPIRKNQDVQRLTKTNRMENLKRHAKDSRKDLRRTSGFSISEGNFKWLNFSKFFTFMLFWSSPQPRKASCDFNQACSTQQPRYSTNHGAACNNNSGQQHCPQVNVGHWDALGTQEGCSQSTYLDHYWYLRWLHFERFPLHHSTTVSQESTETESQNLKFFPINKTFQLRKSFFHQFPLQCCRLSC